MTHPTDKELDALVQMLQQRNKSKHGYTGHPLYNRDGLQAADAITALRAQLAEVRKDRKAGAADYCALMERHDAEKVRADRAEAERAFTVSDGQRLLRKQDILTVCDTPDLCFEHDDGVARCGPCAAKLAERDGIALNQYTVSNPEAMRMRRDLDRAEAERAAQIEASIREVWGCCEELEDEAYAKLKVVVADHEQGFWQGHEQGFWRGQRMTAKRIRRATPMNPHDRTALARLLADAEAKALRDAADKVDAIIRAAEDANLDDRKDGLRDAHNAITRMIPKEGA